MRNVTTTLVLFVGCLALAPSMAHALPSFARQTGEPCTACHTNFPELTPFGRQFKLNGYVLSSGDSKLPHLAVMAQGGFTRTDKGQPGGAAPHFADNDNFSLNQASLFYGGIVVPDYVGAFVQGTYDGVGRDFSWDNADIRFADSATLAGHDLSFGVTANNNPTVSDLWNSTPAWGYPFSASGLAPAPTAGTLIQGGLAQQVAGLGAYVMLDGNVYVELNGYSSLPATAQRSLGVDPSGETEIDGIAPYWRIAGQQTWGNHYLEVGHFGLTAATYPGRDDSAGSDRISDFGFDSQYQYLGDRYSASLLTSFVIEAANWDASLPLGLADNANDMLYSFNLAGSFLYDQTYGITAGYFATFGGKDAALYGTRTGSPNSDGFTVQLDWLPLNKDGGPDFWPMSNIKFSLQYTAYTQFDGAAHNYDGSGRDASDNNTLYLQTWLAF